MLGKEDKGSPLSHRRRLRRRRRRRRLSPRYHATQCVTFDPTGASSSQTLVYDTELAAIIFQFAIRSWCKATLNVEGILKEEP